MIAHARTLIASIAATAVLAACAGIGLGQADPETAPSARQRSAFAASPAPIPAFAHPPMSTMALRDHVEVLASDAFEGRPPAEPAEELTLGYLENAFAQAGLQPGVILSDGSRSWRQEVPLISATVTNEPRLWVNGASFAGLYEYRAQHVVWTKRLDPVIDLTNAPMVFVGYGVVAPELGWNDYAGLDMAGKIAVILVNDPDFETGDDRGFGGRAMTYYGRWTYKFEEAARQGAAGALIIHETAPAAYPWAVVMSSWTGPQLDTSHSANAPPRVAVEGWVSAATATELFTGAGLDFAALKRAAQTQGFTAVEMGLNASIRLESTITESQSYNVVGVLPGRIRPEETVLYSAHWDHLGRCPPVNGDDICNGAMDNGIGTAGLIELARRFGAQGRAERSVAFLAFTAEEQGLLGSIYYAAHPVFPTALTAAAINMDGGSIYGATRDVTITGFGKSDMDDILTGFATAQGRSVVPEPFPEQGGFYRSDHFPLARIGIPVLYARGGIDLVVGGRERGEAVSRAYIADRYHKPDDELTDAWDLTGAVQDLQLYYDVGRSLADSRRWPQWRPTAEFVSARTPSDGERR
jgi:Zn-dependent M28 family amino/carboxypeptidase